MKRLTILFSVLIISAIMVAPAWASCPATHFTAPTPTGLPLLMTFNSADITFNNGQNLAAGDEIAVFAGDGSGNWLLVGLECYPGVDPMPILANGDNAVLPGKDGFEVGDPIRITVYDDDTGSYFLSDVAATFIDPLASPFGMETPSVGGLGAPLGFVTANTPANMSGITVPTVGEWAMIILTLSFMISATLVMRRRQVAVIV